MMYTLFFCLWTIVIFYILFFMKPAWYSTGLIFDSKLYFFICFQPTKLPMPSTSKEKNVFVRDFKWCILCFSACAKNNRNILLFFMRPAWNSTGLIYNSKLYFLFVFSPRNYPCLRRGGDNVQFRRPVSAPLRQWDHRGF